ncbi:MAG: HD domain-containing protein [Chloroflexi bacterium]|nr:HD domain-containing protein [Chloroflexota bacterium]
MNARFSLAEALSGGDPFLQEVVQYVAQTFKGIYLVGGTVRDMVSGRGLQGDVDFAVAHGSGCDVARRVANHFRGAYYPLDQERDTGRAILARHDRRLALDFAHIRGDDILDDLAGRDFTVNALAVDVRTGRLFDPAGGLHDLAKGKLRALSAGVFQADAVRLLRASRQAAELGLTIDADTRDQIIRDAPLLANVSGERVRDEFCRLLALPRGAAHLPDVAQLGLLTTVFPELAALRGLKQPAPHKFDAFEHTIAAVMALEDLLQALYGQPDSAVRLLQVDEQHRPQVAEYLAGTLSAGRSRALLLKFAALLHDAGKPSCRTVDERGRVHFYGHEGVGAEMAGTVLQRLRFSSAEVSWVQTITRNHMRPLQMVNQPASRRAIYRFFRDTGAAGLAVVVLSLADVRATWGPDLTESLWKKHLDVAKRLFSAFFQEREEVVFPPSLINGREVMRHLQLSPGPVIGRLLESVREAQAAGEVRSRAEALALIEQIHSDEQRGA